MKEYPIHDLVIHAFELASPGKMETEALSSYKSFMDWLLMIQGEAYNEENLEQDFRNYMQAEYVVSKSYALLYLQQGITLNCKGVWAHEWSLEPFTHICCFRLV
jgi:hypothetical protein